MDGEAAWLRLRATLAERGFDVALDLGRGERLAILGPNGAGKSTLVSILAGMVHPDGGRAELDGRVLFDLDSPRRAWLPPPARGIGLLAQEPLLFPHLSVLDNVAFAPRARGIPRATARGLARHWLAEVDAEEFAGRLPSQLSGGQAQRVAVARALAADPSLLLLDEPMAALDVGVAPALRRLLRRVLRERAALIVTHDLLDALLLSDRVLVLDRGHVVEAGVTDRVLAHPRTRFTARIAGLNLVRGIAESGAVREPSGYLVQGGGESMVDGSPAAAVFAPTAVSVFIDPPHGSPRNTIGVRVTELEPREDRVRVRAEDGCGHVLTAEVTPAAVADLDLYPGRDVHYSVKATQVTVYPT